MRSLDVVYSLNPDNYLIVKVANSMGSDMARTILALAFLIFALSSALAGDKPGLDDVQKDFILMLGVNEYQVKEKVLNNIKHRGFFPGALGIARDISSAKTLQRYEVFLMFNMLESRYDPDRTSYVLSSSFRYRLLRKFPKTGVYFSYSLGGGISAEHDLVYFYNWDWNRTYWLTSYNLTLDGLLDRELSNESSCWLEASMPVLALVSRPPHRFLDKMGRPDLAGLLGEIHDNMRLTSLHEHFLGKVKLGYTVRKSTGSRRDLFWQIKYARSSMPYSRTIEILSHVFGVQFYF
ncbi:MAG: hypothetical protein V3W14_03005 [Candidatus Neomarinimicrobiota bacterium]